MRLSKRGEYGLRAMIMLAGTPHENAPLPVVQIREISEREKISAKFLEQILLTLKKAGITWPGPPARLPSAKSSACWTVQWRPSNASARCRTNRAAVPMSKPAACGW
jgi:hypothetical protein